MKDLIRFVLLTIEVVFVAIATIADVVIKIFNPFSRAGHRVEAWCEKNREKFARPKEMQKEEPQQA